MSGYYILLFFSSGLSCRTVYDGHFLSSDHLDWLRKISLHCWLEHGAPMSILFFLCFMAKSSTSNIKTALLLACKSIIRRNGQRQMPTSVLTKVIERNVEPQISF